MNHEKRKDKNIPRIKENYLVCPVTVHSSVPVSVFQSLTLLSTEQLAKRFFVGWNATPITSLPKF